MNTTKYNSRINGTGSYLPEGTITNSDLEAMVSTNDQWIRDRTGIISRQKAAPDQNTSDLAYEAASIALARANLDATELDMILVATITPDQIMPSTACVLQQKLGAKQCMALDISAACTGFIYGLSIANEFIVNGTYKNILVVGAEVMTRIVNYKDRDTCILFGDGAGAAVLSRAAENEESIIYSHHLHADGQYGDLFELPAGGSAIPFSQQVLDEGLQYMLMKGKDIFKQAVRTMSQCCQEALDHNHMTANDIAWIVPHQANFRILEAVARHFKVSMEKVVVEIAYMGNTSAATVAVSLDRAVNDERIQRGQNILFTAFGAGLTSGSLLMRY
jgi:3-oxoacyl-[acyl-carrier-protein] synthase-3